MDNKRKVEIDDFMMNYYEEGEGENLIFLHGNGMHSIQFKKMFKKFAQFKKVIALDMRGCGGSTYGDKNISMHLLVDDIIMFLEKKQIKKATIVGYSDGANLGMMIAKKSPDLVSKLVLISGNYNTDGVCEWFKLVLKIYRLILKIGALFSKNFIKKIEILNMMFEDMKLDDSDLKKFNMKTLVLYCGIDVIHKKHSRRIHELIKNSAIIYVRNSTHESIIRNNFAINEIESFIK